MHRCKDRHRIRACIKAIREGGTWWDGRDGRGREREGEAETDTETKRHRERERERSINRQMLGMYGCMHVHLPLWQGRFDLVS